MKKTIYLLTGVLLFLLLLHSCKKDAPQTNSKSTSINTSKISSLECLTATHIGTLTARKTASGVASVISYTGGNGGTHKGQVVSSTGVTGLTATLLAGTLANGAGTLVYTISGTPTTAGTANFVITLGGKSCSININVEDANLTTPTVSYKNFSCTSDNSILKVEQCVVIKEPSSDLLWMTLKLKYTGVKFASFPKLIIRGKDKNGKVLFEDLSYLNNVYSAVNYYSNIYGNAFISKTSPNAYAYGLVDLTKYVGDSAFSFEDVQSLEITNIELDELEIKPLDSSLAFETIQNNGQKLISNFKNQSQMELKFDSYHLCFFQNDKGDLLSFDFVEVLPKLIFKPNDSGYFAISNTYFNHKVSNADFTIRYELNTVTRTISNVSHNNDYLLSKKIMEEDYQLIKNNK